MVKSETYAAMAAVSSTKAISANGLQQMCKACAQCCASYGGDTFANWVKTVRPKLEVKVVKRSDDVQGFKVLPWRWVVERTFDWLMYHRRLVRDYERTISSAEACVYIAMIRIQLRRLA